MELTLAAIKKLVSLEHSLRINKGSTNWLEWFPQRITGPLSGV